MKQSILLRHHIPAPFGVGDVMRHGIAAAKNRQMVGDEVMHRHKLFDFGIEIMTLKCGNHQTASVIRRGEAINACSNKVLKFYFDVRKSPASLGPR